jgi:hypothetical protein
MEIVSSLLAMRKYLSRRKDTKPRWVLNIN